MTAMPHSNPEIEEIKRAYKEQQERQIRFEVSYVEGRKRLFDDVSSLAQGLLVVTEATRDTQIRVKGVENDVKDLKASSGRVEESLAALSQRLTERFESDDLERGALLVELAKLHKADSSLQGNDVEMREEITEVRQMHVLATTQIEQERARTTLRQGVATVFGGALVSYLKANPDAFERAWKLVGGLVQP
jgi:hypothetical protein